MKKIKQAIKKITNPEEMKRISKWQEKLETAKLAYDPEIKNMIEWQSYYDGTKSIKQIGNVAPKDANTVKNITYELIESQVDPSVPYPKITPLHSEDVEQARLIEKALGSMVTTLRMNLMNDMSERDVPIKGGDLYMVEWDNTKSTHTTLGGIEITEIDPKNFIPQPGVVEINKMDYFFVRQALTKQTVKARFGVDVEDASEEDAGVRGESTGKSTVDNDIVTVNMCYYKAKGKNIGLYIWCDDFELYDNDNYQCRELEVCSKCGLSKSGDICECGNKKFIKEKQETETLYEPKILSDGTIIEPSEEIEEIAVDEIGQPILNELGQQEVRSKTVQTEIPYYQPNVYPVVLRKNVSKKNTFLGSSDVNVIVDQQQNINKIGSKIIEKILKGGSVLVLPEELQIDCDGTEMNIIRTRDPSQAAQIGVKTLQPDIGNDMAVLQTCYQDAKSGLGITDSFQGKYDPSATSGTAKQYAINQAAGRLESKRTMKAEAFSLLYEIIFKTWLAYSDQPMPISSTGSTGEIEFAELDRFMFLKKDASGEYYWNDEFIFETNPTSSLMANREAMWAQTDQKLQGGAFGPLGELKTMQLYWHLMELSNYPNAGAIKKVIDDRMKEQQQINKAQELMQQTPQEGEKENVMSGM